LMGAFDPFASLWDPIREPLRLNGDSVRYSEIFERMGEHESARKSEEELKGMSKGLRAFYERQSPFGGVYSLCLHTVETNTPDDMLL
jgi:hypothetical protein